MKIYAELKLNGIFLQIDGERLEIRIKPEFYRKVKGTESYQMFLDKTINSKISGFINKQRNKLGFYQKLGYIFLRNTAFVLVDDDVQKLTTIRLLHAYATLSLDARVIYILRRPEDFPGDLEAMEKMKEEFVNNGKYDQDRLMSKLGEGSRA